MTTTIHYSPHILVQYCNHTSLTDDFLPQLYQLLLILQVLVLTEGCLLQDGKQSTSCRGQKNSTSGEGAEYVTVTIPGSRLCYIQSTMYSTYGKDIHMGAGEQKASHHTIIYSKTVFVHKWCSVPASKILASHTFISLNKCAHLLVESISSEYTTVPDNAAAVR